MEVKGILIISERKCYNLFWDFNFTFEHSQMPSGLIENHRRSNIIAILIDIWVTKIKTTWIIFFFILNFFPSELLPHLSQPVIHISDLAHSVATYFSSRPVIPNSILHSTVPMFVSKAREKGRQKKKKKKAIWSRLSP